MPLEILYGIKIGSLNDICTIFTWWHGAEYFYGKRKLNDINYIEKIITEDYEFYETMNRILRNLARYNLSL